MNRYIVPLLLLAVIIVAGCSEDSSSNKAPKASLNVLPDHAIIYDNGTAGTDYPTVTFDGNESSDDDGIVNYHFDFGNGETKDSQEATEDKEYLEAGFFDAHLQVEDKKGKTDRVNREVVIDYEARRSGFVDSQGNSEETEIYHVSEFKPVNGTAYVHANDDSVGDTGTDLTIVFMDSDGDELHREEWSDISDGDTLQVDMDKSFLNDWGYGDYQISIEATRGASNYNIEIFIFHES